MQPVWLIAVRVDPHATVWLIAVRVDPHAIVWLIAVRADPHATCMVNCCQGGSTCNLYG